MTLRNFARKEYPGRSYGVCDISRHHHNFDMLYLDLLSKGLDLLLCVFISKIVQYESRCSMFSKVQGTYIYIVRKRKRAAIGSSPGSAYTPGGPRYAYDLILCEHLGR